MNKKNLLIGILALLPFSSFAQNVQKPTFSVVLPAGTSSTIQVAPNSTAAISYIVTNNTKLTRTLTTGPILGISQNTSSGNCSSPFVLAPGQSCTLALTINGAQIPATGVRGGPVVCKTRGPGNNLPDPNLCSQPTPSSALNISTASTPSFLSQAISLGNAIVNNMLLPMKANLPSGSTPWRVKPIVSFVWSLFTNGFNIPSTASLYSVSCGTDNGASFCALVGSHNGAPSLFQSTNGGLSWSPITISGLPTSGKFNGVSCATSAGVNTCTAIGADASGGAFIVQTINSGQSWSMIAVADLQFSTLHSVDCTANAASSLCQVTAYDSSAGPVIFYSISGATWQSIYLASSSISPSSNLGAISCVSLPSTNISCLVALNGNTVGNPTLVKGFLNVSTYQVTPVTSAVTEGGGITINAVGCTLNAGTAFCTAAGTGSGLPFLVQNSDISSDSGWSPVFLSSDPIQLLATSCVAFNGTVLCNAAGKNTATNAPVLFNTINNGSNWSAVTVPNAPTLGTYYTSSCTNSQGKPVCTVSGADSTKNIPLIVESSNTMGVWARSQTLSTIYSF
ncbi:hypothetical protein [Legionella saoudiensis]|uniref:hypothetical protein n=1 Tax=Legionella saoudiensis TaxID=1750561 RepID=UPI000731C7A2|nr:hypothetical protein [Legionella saoudiensis]